MEVKGTLIIKCDNCKTDNSIGSDEAQFEVQESEQREFGVERNWVYDFEFECSKCNNEISGTDEKWESPIGQGGIENLSVDGGEAQNTFDFEFSVEE